MYYQFRKTRNRYNSYPKSDECHFCNPGESTEPTVRETEHAYVVPNRTFYDLWEIRKIVDHKLLIPKRHVAQLKDLTAEERTDIINLIADYEAEGYEVYARSPKSVTRSIDHQHTHLIKATGKPGRGLFYLSKPYILLRLP
ncbi:hypothetical protein BH09PAT3_BH09PAT3_2460 [soil metagenome]